MPDTEAPAGRDATHDELESALSGSPAGRRFLAEHARRARGGDTSLLLDAISRLERRVATRTASDEMVRLRCDLADMSDAIGRTKADIAELTRAVGAKDLSGAANPLAKASEALDAIVHTTERATSDILDATEKIQETAWTMREGGFEAELCDALDQRATEIYAACAFQDLTAQAIGRVVRSLAFLEERIGMMNRIWGQQPPPARVPLDEHKLALTQSDIDFVIVDDARAEPGATEPAGTGRAADMAAHDAETAARRAARDAALAHLDALDAMATREKLLLFT